MAKVCIICEKEIQPGSDYYRVRDDAIIKAIRAVKQRLGVAKNNELCVDQGCLPKYRERRKKFEKNIIFYVALGVIVFVLINGLQLMAGAFSIVAFIASLFLAVLIAGLAILNYATPPIDEAMLTAGSAQERAREDESVSGEKPQQSGKKPAKKGRSR
ncbi:Uncharacterised protein [uncultured archaeon]|nr:Uncharacterised protein [uncultured archaeon]